MASLPSVVAGICVGDKATHNIDVIKHTAQSAFITPDNAKDMKYSINGPSYLHEMIECVVL